MDISDIYIYIYIYIIYIPGIAIYFNGKHIRIATIIIIAIDTYVCI